MFFISFYGKHHAIPDLRRSYYRFEGFRPCFDLTYLLDRPRYRFSGVHLFKLWTPIQENPEEVQKVNLQDRRRTFLRSSRYSSGMTPSSTTVSPTVSNAAELMVSSVFRFILALPESAFLR